jgi:hypothetical protein
MLSLAASTTASATGRATCRPSRCSIRVPRAAARRNARTSAMARDGGEAPAVGSRLLAHADKKVLGLGVLVAYVLCHTDPVHAADLLSGDMDASQLEPQALWDLAEGVRALEHLRPLPPSLGRLSRRHTNADKTHPFPSTALHRTHVVAVAVSMSWL